VAEIHLIREAAPALTDIPGMLRRTADRIEAGELGDVSSAFVLVPAPGDYPKIFGFGDIERGNDPIIQFELAKLWLLTNLVHRG
jgi:hypothetical protein